MVGLHRPERPSERYHVAGVSRRPGQSSTCGVRNRGGRQPFRTSHNILRRTRSGDNSRFDCDLAVVTGKPMVRLQAHVSILPFTGGFEVAIPVAER